MNNKNYRDTVLAYVKKLGEIDKVEDEIFWLKQEVNLEEVDTKEKQLAELKQEAASLKQEIDNCKGKNK